MKEPPEICLEAQIKPLDEVIDMLYRNPDYIPENRFSFIQSVCFEYMDDGEISERQEHWMRYYWQEAFLTQDIPEGADMPF